jgi:hypothetical protein
VSLPKIDGSYKLAVPVTNPAALTSAMISQYQRLEVPVSIPARTRYSGGVGRPVAYLLQSWFNNRGVCQCGWQGKRRWLRGNAVLDVVAHCQSTQHVPVGLPPLIHARTIAG